MDDARTWLIGSSPECDLVVPSPTVSGRHCVLREDGDGFIVEDLASSNGTFVDGVPIGAPRRVRRGAAVTLGRATPMPWPDAAPSPSPSLPAVTIRVGRDPVNDVVIDDPRVSGFHARLVVADGRATIEDLGSTNGTAIGSLESRISRAALGPGDTVYLGSLAVPAARLLAAAAREQARAASAGRLRDRAGRAEPAAQSPAPLEVPPAAEPVPFEPAGGRTLLAREVSRATGRARGLAALLAQVPLIALALLALRGAALGFGLGAAALWLGGSTGAWGMLGERLWFDAERRRGRGIGPFVGVKMAVLGGLGLIECAGLLAVVAARGVLGSWGTALGFLVLLMLAGLALGLLAATACRSAAAAFAVLLGIVAGSMLLGGFAPTLARLPAPARLVAGLSPVRWGFEGLLLAEAEGRPTALDGADPPTDLAEPYFPAESERMGPRACALALAALAVALVGLEALALGGRDAAGAG